MASDERRGTRHRFDYLATVAAAVGTLLGLLAASGSLLGAAVRVGLAAAPEVALSVTSVLVAFLVSLTSMRRASRTRREVVRTLSDIQDEGTRQLFRELVVGHEEFERTLGRQPEQGPAR